jgi:hypothetical protein
VAGLLPTGENAHVTADLELAAVLTTWRNIKREFGRPIGTRIRPGGMARAFSAHLLNAFDFGGSMK